MNFISLIQEPNNQKGRLSIIATPLKKGSWVNPKEMYQNMMKILGFIYKIIYSRNLWKAGQIELIVLNT